MIVTVLVLLRLEVALLAASGEIFFVVARSSVQKKQKHSMYHHKIYGMYQNNICMVPYHCAYHTASTTCSVV